jgi:hypothetical protein
MTPQQQADEALREWQDAREAGRGLRLALDCVGNAVAILSIFVFVAFGSEALRLAAALMGASQ